MTGGAKKSAPREKSVRFANTRYEVLQTSFINGALQHPGAFVYLPEGVQAGKNLRAVGGGSAADQAEDPPDNTEAFLNRTVPEVVAELADASDEELVAYLNSEKGGKARVGVIDAIEREKETRNQ